MGIHGDCDRRFTPLRDAFIANFEAGEELGASLAATLHGEPVVDLWAGWAHVARTRPWARDGYAPNNFAIDRLADPRVSPVCAAMRAIAETL
ncbi:hypothetical protein [Phenylobacterium sp.]|jgi:hypothetical protein|uniref:hypothetical protein n=1 Tax=Phenylobacterium sp. TaxID=1871053 RepID=UPI002F4292FE